MTIYINLSGGFGNNIHQYIVGVIIASKRKENVMIIKHYHAVTNEDSMLSIYKVIKDNVNCSKDCNWVNTIEERDYRVEIKDMYFPFKYQEIYKNRENILKSYFNWDKIELPIEIKETDIIVSLRLGMLNREVVANSPYLYEYPKGYRIGFKYYKEVLDKMCNGEKGNDKRIIICCDNYEDTFINNFDSYKNVILAKYNTLVQYKILLSANILISPDSSFGITAMLLSNAKETKVFKVVIDEGIKVYDKYSYFEIKEE